MGNRYIFHQALLIKEKLGQWKICRSLKVIHCLNIIYCHLHSPTPTYHMSIKKDQRYCIQEEINLTSESISNKKGYKHENYIFNRLLQITLRVAAFGRWDRPLIIYHSLTVWHKVIFILLECNRNHSSPETLCLLSLLLECFFITE